MFTIENHPEVENGQSTVCGISSPGLYLVPDSTVLLTKVYLEGRCEKVRGQSLASEVPVNKGEADLIRIREDYFDSLANQVIPSRFL